MADIIGTLGNDSLDGTLGDDSIQGLAGNDTINPLQGNFDEVDGGSGNDLLILDYSSNTFTGNNSGISSSIVTGSDGSDGRFRARIDENYNYDRTYFENIERFNITGTSANDNIVTGDGNDTLDGGVGNDTLDGGDGNDSIRGGQGNDLIIDNAGINDINGGAGIDTLQDADLSLATANLTFDESDTSQSLTLPNGTSIVSIERFTGSLTTGSGNDVFAFSQRADNDIDAGSGNDTINAGLGNFDRVDGGSGNDLLIVDYSSNTFTGNNSGISSSIVTGSDGSDGRFRARIDENYNYDRTYFENIERFNITGTSAEGATKQS